MAASWSLDVDSSVGLVVFGEKSLGRIWGKMEMEDQADQKGEGAVEELSSALKTVDHRDWKYNTTIRKIRLRMS